MKVGLLVVVRYYGAGEYTLTSQFLKFNTTEDARQAGEDIRNAYSHAGYSVTSKIVQGVA